MGISYLALTSRARPMPRRLSAEAFLFPATRLSLLTPLHDPAVISEQCPKAIGRPAPNSPCDCRCDPPCLPPRDCAAGCHP